MILLVERARWRVHLEAIVGLEFLRDLLIKGLQKSPALSELGFLLTSLSLLFWLSGHCMFQKEFFEWDKDCCLLPGDSSAAVVFAVSSFELEHLRINFDDDDLFRGWYISPWSLLSLVGLLFSVSRWTYRRFREPSIATRQYVYDPCDRFTQWFVERLFSFVNGIFALLRRSVGVGWLTDDDTRTCTYVCLSYVQSWLVRQLWLTRMWRVSSGSWNHLLETSD